MRSTVLRLGTLDDDLTSIAGAVCHLLDTKPCMVWIDDSRRIFLGEPDQHPPVPVRWIVGTFGAGHSLRCIEDDLRAMAQERAGNPMPE